MGSDDTPSLKCPYCGAICEADWCDVGVGVVQCGPYHCENCYASEIGKYDEIRELSDDEQSTGWYGPNQPPGSSANVVYGKIVDHEYAREVYVANYPYSATKDGRKKIRGIDT